MQDWIEIIPSGIILTTESEAYLELAKEDLSKYEYSDARTELEVAVHSGTFAPQSMVMRRCKLPQPSCISMGMIGTLKLCHNSSITW